MIMADPAIATNTIPSSVNTNHKSLSSAMTTGLSVVLNIAELGGDVVVIMLVAESMAMLRVVVVVGNVVDNVVRGPVLMPGVVLGVTTLFLVRHMMSELLHD